MVSNNSTVDADLDEKLTGSPLYLVWIYGFLCIFAISSTSLLGLLFRPFAKKPWYKKIILFLMASSVGILSSTSMFFLLPEAIELDLSENSSRIRYINKICVLFSTLFALLNFEIFFKRIVKWRSEVGQLREKEADEKELQLLSQQEGTGEKSDEATETDKIAERENQEWAVRPRLPEEVAAGERASAVDLSQTSLIWVILAGDGIHSFVDGMAIGVAMTSKLLGGVGVALVIFIEELPHKLGDIAVLLHAGLTLGRAVTYCFIASIPAFAGFASGVLLKKMVVSASSWVFAIATALFLYVAFVDILPEVIEHIDAEKEPTQPSEQNRKNAKKRPAPGNESCLHMLLSLRRLPIVNCGMVAGFLTAMLICLYGENIQLD